MKCVNVAAPSKEYNVFIESGLLPRAGGMIADVCGGEHVMLVSDETVYGLYGSIAEDSLRSAGYRVDCFTFPSGETSKSMETYTALIGAIARANLSRTDVVTALGGGVTGDLAGFAAATWLRGVKFAQIPTTLLSMVDSSVGGKTAVDIPSGKNMVGSFYQPDIVICDCGTLTTLSDRVFRDGCAEMIKQAMIRSAVLFETLRNCSGIYGNCSGIKLTDTRIEDIIAQNVVIKRDIVSADEREKGLRRLLNFGHTLGHGIEKHSGYSKTHGECVAIGMAIVTKGAARAGLCDAVCYEEVESILRLYGLPVDTDISPKNLIEAAAFDKKRDGQSITFIVPERVGVCRAKTCSMSEFASFVYTAMKAN